MSVSNIRLCKSNEPRVYIPNYDKSELTQKYMLAGEQEPERRISQMTAAESQNKQFSYLNSRGNFSDPVNLVDHSKENIRVPINNYLSSTNNSSTRNITQRPCVSNLEFELVQFEREQARLQDLVRKRSTNQRTRAEILAKHSGKLSSKRNRSRLLPPYDCRDDGKRTLCLLAKPSN